MSKKFQLRRGTAANLPNLSLGELGYCTDTHELYIGNGINNTLVNVASLSSLTPAEKTAITDHMADADIHVSLYHALWLDAITVTDVEVNYLANVASNIQTQINNKQNSLGFTPEDSSKRNQINGYAGLGTDGKIDWAQLPAIAISNTFVVNTEVDMLAITGEPGDVAIRLDLTKTFILQGADASILSNWQELLSPTGQVSSVAGKTGVVTLSKEDVGLGNVDNTSDLDKPISTTMQTALDAKADIGGLALTQDSLLFSIIFA